LLKSHIVSLSGIRSPDGVTLARVPTMKPKCTESTRGARKRSKIYHSYEREERVIYFRAEALKDSGRVRGRKCAAQGSLSSLGTCTLRERERERELHLFVRA